VRRLKLFVQLTVCVLASCHAREHSQPSGTAKSQMAWVAVHPGTGPLAALVAAEIATHPTGNLKPIVYLGASWCGPCQEIKRSKDDPRMLDAFDGAMVIEVDIDEWNKEQLTALGYKTGVIPVFIAVDRDARALGPMIDGGAWGDNVPEIMAPPLKKFVTLVRASH
jgi:thiol-disulfide isomerase/thioredoxin